MMYAHTLGDVSWGSRTRTNSNIQMPGWSASTPSASAQGLKGTQSLSPKAVALIGQNGLRRFQEFSEYPKGWDGVDSKSLNPLSIASCDFFVNSLAQAPQVPSIFMTRRGNLQLGWEAHDGSRIELEFLPNKIEYLIGDDEGTFEIADIGVLVGRLSAT